MNSADFAEHIENCVVYAEFEEPKRRMKDNMGRNQNEKKKTSEVSGTEKDFLSRCDN